jgi:hypothetical protein
MWERLRDYVHVRLPQVLTFERALGIQTHYEISCERNRYVRLRHVSEMLKWPWKFRLNINIHVQLPQGRETLNAPWEFRHIITFKLSEIDITCR